MLKPINPVASVKRSLSSCCHQELRALATAVPAAMLLRGCGYNILKYRVVVTAVHFIAEC